MCFRKGLVDVKNDSLKFVKYGGHGLSDGWVVRCLDGVESCDGGCLKSFDEQ